MRKAQAKKLPLSPDPRFNDKLVTRFVNNLMWEGKKSGAFNIFYDALDNVKPTLEVKSRRVGGSTYQVPVEVRVERRNSLAMRWLARYANARSEKTATDKLAGEIVAASKGEGAAFKKKEDTHRMAEANKAFAHFRV